MREVGTSTLRSYVLSDPKHPKSHHPGPPSVELPPHPTLPVHRSILIQQLPPIQSLDRIPRENETPIALGGFCPSVIHVLIQSCLGILLGLGHNVLHGQLGQKC